MSILLHLLTAVLYAGLALYFWKSRWALKSVASKPTKTQGWERLVILIPVALHIWIIYGVSIAGMEIRFSFSTALSLMLLLAVLLYWIESFFYSLEGIQTLVFIAAALCVPLPVLFPTHHILIHTDSIAFKAHFLGAMLAYSLFTIAALHALLMVFTEKKLHSAAVSGIITQLPPLLTMEAMLFRIIGIGFFLLTITLISGILFSETLFGRPLTFNHKIIFGVVSWLIFGALLLGRYYRGWRGRTALRWTFIGFAALLLAYVGTRFVLEVILGRN